MRRAMPGPFVDHRGVELDQAGAGTDPRPGIVGTGDPADADQRDFAAARPLRNARKASSASDFSGAPKGRPLRPQSAI